MDKQQINKLTENGWNVIVVWECQLKAGMIDQTMLELINRIKSYKKTANTAHPLIWSTGHPWFCSQLLLLIA